MVRQMRYGSGRRGWQDLAWTLCAIAVPTQGHGLSDQLQAGVYAACVKAPLPAPAAP